MAEYQKEIARLRQQLEENQARLAASPSMRDDHDTVESLQRRARQLESKARAKSATLREREQEIEAERRFAPSPFDVQWLLYFALPCWWSSRASMLNHNTPTLTHSHTDTHTHTQTHTHTHTQHSNILHVLHTHKHIYELIHAHIRTHTHTHTHTHTLTYNAVCCLSNPSCGTYPNTGRTKLCTSESPSWNRNS